MMPTMSTSHIPLLGAMDDQFFQQPSHTNPRRERRSYSFRQLYKSNHNQHASQLSIYTELDEKQIDGSHPTTCSGDTLWSFICSKKKIAYNNISNASSQPTSLSQRLRSYKSKSVQVDSSNATPLIPKNSSIATYRNSPRSSLKSWKASVMGVVYQKST
ncbi:hypothetical protein BDF20DRAFT_124698 [Mycotypha africana]|uniref:uncharacterized protein n=1 Tax=Mycotypha africana TaxID=64632 RepID=UPI0023018BDA|nr:uncharacterized protein BDF20DRAFT_124698 [Mycotypha africana]KAI8970437.1 hypothetical protein BDF20DRAFT_124698 [Mycotypha africana]